MRSNYGLCNHTKDGAEFGYNKANEWHYVKDAYLASAEPREKRMAELEKRLEKAKLVINHLLPHAEFSCHGTVNDWKIKEAKKFLKKIGK